MSTKAGDDENDRILHEKCSVLVVSTNGGFESFVGRKRGLIPHGDEMVVVSCNILQVGGKNAASVSVKIHDVAGWLVLLQPESTWTCISAAFSSSLAAVHPQDFQAVGDLTWDGYVKANRSCSGSAMAQVFHETCRLTYASQGEVHIFSQNQFCNKVENRYSLAPHSDFAEHSSDSRLNTFDSLDAIEFCGSALAMVTLRVGHLPCLWTDYLTCAKINERWWIVHKSSCNEAHPLLKSL